MAKMTDNNADAQERKACEEEAQEQRKELAPRLATLVDRAVSYYDIGGGWRVGYLLKVGDVNASMQPIAARKGELPDPIRVDILDVKAAAILQTKYPTLEDYLKGNGYDRAKEPQKKLDPVVKRERVAKVKVTAQAAVRGEKQPKAERGNATEAWLNDLRAIGEENLRRVMPGFKALATTREGLGAEHLVKAGKELFTGLWVTSNFSSDAKAKLLAKVREAAK